MIDGQPRDFLSTLEYWAGVDPAAVAIRNDGNDTTYSQLVDAIRSRADVLVEAGLKTGDRVALVADNSAEYLMTAFAVWQATGVLVTIYPSSGEHDLAHCLVRGDPVLVIADTRAAASTLAAAPDGLPVVVLGPGLTVDRLSDTSKPSSAGTGEGLALICFTSGSTDTPKAVMHSSEGLFRAARAYADVWHIGRADRTVVCLPMAWAFGLVTTSMATLVAGGTVLSLSRMKPELLVAAVKDDGATLIAGVTTLFAKLVEHLEALDDDPDFSSLRLCISGGEPRNELVFDAWTAMTGCPVHDVYAASECFPVVTYDPTEDPRPVRRSSGKVVAGASMRILDRDGNDIPVGGEGEAVWKGPALMLGYWQDDELTRSALTEDGWYRTNDLVRVDERGYVFVEGRLSDMIIRGGSNVSPGEVENVLREHPSVVDAAVVGLPDETYGQRVVAAVVVGDSGSFDSDEVAAFSRTQLASYKVPTVYVVVAELPLHRATGKVDRRGVAADLSSKDGAA